MKGQLASGNPNPGKLDEHRLRLQSTARFQMFMAKRGAARRQGFEMIRGVAQDVIPSVGNRYAFSIDARRVELSGGHNAILVSNGDLILAAARIGDPLRASMYFNETTGEGSLESAYKTSRSLLTTSLYLAVGGLAVLLTVVFAARADLRYVSASAFFHAPIYGVALLAGMVMLLGSSLFLTIGLTSRRMWALVHAVATAE